MTYTFTTDNFQVDKEDNGAALIGNMIEGVSQQMFVRVQSWDRSREHDEIKKLVGKKVRVIVEVVED